MDRADATAVATAAAAAAAIAVERVVAIEVAANAVRAADLVVVAKAEVATVADEARGRAKVAARGVDTGEMIAVLLDRRRILRRSFPFRSNPPRRPSKR